VPSDEPLVRAPQADCEDAGLVEEATDHLTGLREKGGEHLVARNRSHVGEGGVSPSGLDGMSIVS